MNEWMHLIPPNRARSFFLFITGYDLLMLCLVIAILIFFVIYQSHLNILVIAAFNKKSTFQDFLTLEELE
jgi:hypothetical protein